MRITYYVEVLHNVTEDEDGRMAIFSRYGDQERFQSDDVMETVWTGEIVVDEPQEDLFQKIYGMFNGGSPNFIGSDAYPHRSLSPGDAIIIDEADFWYCEPTGWRSGRRTTRA